MTYQTQKQLLIWFDTHKREMPWRNDPSPYRVWISEVMLQQTTVATAHNYFLKFIERFPNLQSLACADEEEVLLLWAGLGYYSRAKNLLKTAKILNNKKTFPSDIKNLKKLPGIGAYTAAAISSIAFNHPDALVDTNVDRVLGRVYALNRHDKNFTQQLFNYAELLMKQVSLYNPELIWVWNQALMEIGALLCKAKQVNCEKCPLQNECKASQIGAPLAFPGDKIKIKINNKIEFVTIIKIQKKIVLMKIQNQRRQGLYDFPLCEENKNLDIFYQFSYRISNDKIRRYIYLSEEQHYQLQDNEILITIDEALTKFPLTSSCKKIVKKLKKILDN